MSFRQIVCTRLYPTLRSTSVETVGLYNKEEEEIRWSYHYSFVWWYTDQDCLFCCLSLSQIIVS